MVHASNGKYTSTKWTGDGDLEVDTWFRSKNQIRPFGHFTYIHRSTYQIMSLEFEHKLERYQALKTKTARLVGQTLLCINRSYLIKEFIKSALILNLNIHHALYKKRHTTC